MSRFNASPDRRLVLAGIAAAVLARPAFAQAAQWNLASPYPENSYMTTNNRQFAADVAKATGDRVKIAVHAGASLFKLPEVKRAVQTQQVAMGEVLLGAWANEDAMYGAAMMPFIMRDIRDAKILWEVQKPFVAERLAKQNLLLLHCVVWPGQSIFTRRPITSFADIRGMKFRVQNPTTARLAELMGVTGVRVETVDIPQAFLTGTIDGMYTSNETTATLKGWDYVKYAYETNAWYPMNITFVNNAMFEALPEVDRKAVLEASRAAETRGWGMEADETREKTAMLRAHGVEVLPPPPALMTELRAIGDKMLAEWKSAVGPDGPKFLDEYNRRRGA